MIRKIDEIQNEIFQLENNIQFFTNTKNAKKENSIVLEVRKNIALHKEKRILHTANLGDSGFVVIRKNAIVHRSEEQQHYFNSPFQLAIHPSTQDPRLIADR